MPRSRLFWFFNAVAFTVLVFAALNSISYFFRSQDWGYWLTASRAEAKPEAIGFPLQIWSSSDVYPALPLDLPATIVNGLVVAVVSLAAGVTSLVCIGFLNRFFVAMIEKEMDGEAGRLQFSLQGMLVVTAVAAVVATLIRQSFGPRPELLLAVYFLGPAFLILLAMIPRRINWQSRMVLLIPSTILMIYYAIHIGGKLGLEMDRIMLGICICWVPQTVIAAVALMLFHFWQFIRESKAHESNALAGSPNKR